MLIITTLTSYIGFSQNDTELHNNTVINDSITVSTEILKQVAADLIRYDLLQEQITLKDGIISEKNTQLHILSESLTATELKLSNYKTKIQLYESINGQQQELSKSLKSELTRYRRREFVLKTGIVTVSVGGIFVLLLAK